MSTRFPARCFGEKTISIMLAHRLVLAGAGDTDAERRVMEEILKRVEVPVEDWKKK